MGKLFNNSQLLDAKSLCSSLLMQETISGIVKYDDSKLSSNRINYFAYIQFRRHEGIYYLPFFNHLKICVTPQKIVEWAKYE